MILKEPRRCGVRPEGGGPGAQTGECLKTVGEGKRFRKDLFSLKKCFKSQDNKKMKRSLEEEQRARKDLEKVVRRVLKTMNDPTWDETNL